MSATTVRTHGSEAAARSVLPWRFFDVHVQRTVAIGPNFLRVTLVGDDLDRFADNGADQRVKVIFPMPGSGTRGFPAPGEHWWPRWQALPADRRNAVRTYTVRALRPGRRELDVDIVSHGGGPAATWFARARRGERLLVFGPDADYAGDHGGRAWSLPPTAHRVLLVGDETAVPAVAAIGGSLPAHVTGHVLLEVPNARDFTDLTLPGGVEVCWLARGSAPRGRGLVDLVRQTAPGLVPTAPVADLAQPTDDTPLWEVPTTTSTGDAYAWVAADSDTVHAIRRLLLHDLHADRRAVAFMSYWRSGRREC